MPILSLVHLLLFPDDDRTGNSQSDGQGGIFVPDVKSRTLGSDSLYDLSEHEHNWELKGKKSAGATGGWNAGLSQKGGSSGASATSQRTLPEQLKVFKGDELSGYKPTSPKNRRMLYSGSSYNSTSRPSFPGSFFPLESSPRHQRRAVNISEPFAVSVPLRVSAVISSNSTPCRGLAKDRMAATTLKACRETSEQSNGGKVVIGSEAEPDKRDGSEKKKSSEPASSGPPEGKSCCVFQPVLECRLLNNDSLFQIQPHPKAFLFFLPSARLLTRCVRRVWQICISNPNDKLRVLLFNAGRMIDPSSRES